MPNEDLTKKFFQDPDWKLIEDMILKHISPLVDMNDIDYSQPAEHVKAEVIGRVLAYNSLIKFLNDSKIVGRPLKEYKSPFR